MADPTLPQLPTLPTALSPQVAASITKAPLGLGALGAGLAQRFGSPGVAQGQEFTANSPSAVSPVPVAPVSGSGVPPVAASPGVNPYAPGGVIPATPSPAAIARFYQSAPLPAATVAAANAPAAPADPLAGQIRFVDQNSPRATGPGGAAPNVIRGGVGVPGGEAGGITPRDLAAVAPLVPPVKSPAERAGHSLMDFYDAEHQADIDMAAAAKANDPAAIAAAQQHQAFFKSPQSLRYLMNLKTLSLPTFGTTEAQMQATQR